MIYQKHPLSGTGSKKSGLVCDFKDSESYSWRQVNVCHRSSYSVYVVSKYRKQGVPGGDDKARKVYLALFNSNRLSLMGS